MNEQRKLFPKIDRDYEKLMKDVKEVPPADFKRAQLNEWDLKNKELQNHFSKGKYSDNFKRLISAEQDLSFLMYLMDFAMYREYEQGTDSTSSLLKQPLPVDYFDFLKRININSNTLLVPGEASYLINRIEYAQPFTAVYKYSNKLEGEALEKMKKEDKFRDSIAYNVFNLNGGNLYDIIKIHKTIWVFNSGLKRAGNADKINFLEGVKSVVSKDFFRSELDNMYNQILLKTPGKGSEIPTSYAGTIFKKIIEPYKGKMVLVDFWATTCGPCVAGIKNNLEMRRKLKDNKDLDFLFITSEDESPKNDYDNFINENELHNTVYLNMDNYRYLRELFQFNGIPRYVLIDASGNILNNNVDDYRYEFSKAFPKYNEIIYSKTSK